MPPIRTAGGHLSTVALNGVTQATWANYDAADRPGTVTYSNGVTTTYAYDVLDRLTHLTTTTNTPQAGTILQDLLFDWYWTLYPSMPTNGRVLGNIRDNRPSTTAPDGTNTSETQNYSYDTLYRLTAANGVWGSRAYQYDGGSPGIGDPNSFGGFTQRALTFSRGHQVLSGTDSANWNLQNVLYDVRGNMIRKRLNGDEWDYGWTTENRLTHVRKDGGPVADMVYDASGQRVKKVSYPQSGQTVTARYIDRTYETWEVDNGLERTRHHTVHLLGNGTLVLSRTVDEGITGEPSRQVLSGTTQYGPWVGTSFYHRNHINSSTVITDEHGAQKSRLVYMPFGEVAAANSWGDDRVTSKYTGQQADEEFGRADLGGLYYYNARYYDPSIGRFLSADALIPNPGNAQAYNRYSYVMNDPISHIDPSGYQGYPCNAPTVLCSGGDSSQSAGPDTDWPSPDVGGPGPVPGWGGNGNIQNPNHPRIPPGFGSNVRGPWRDFGYGTAPTQAPGLAAIGHGLPGDPINDPNGINTVMPSAGGVSSDYLRSPEYVEYYELYQRASEAKLERELGVRKVQTMAPYMVGAESLTLEAFKQSAIGAVGGYLFGRALRFTAKWLLAEAEGSGATIFLHGTTTAAAEDIAANGVKAVSTNTHAFPPGSFFTFEASQPLAEIAASHMPIISGKAASTGVQVVSMRLPNSVLNALRVADLV